MTTPAAKQLRCTIYGCVQGVFFRAETCEEARRLNLTGWVRNCADGSVECVAEGPEDKLNTLREWMGHGPIKARVTRVDEHWDAACGTFMDFRVA